MSTFKKLVLTGILTAIAAASASAQLRPAAVVLMTESGTFEPQTVYVYPGDIVVWENHDSFWHSVKTDIPNFGPESDLVFRYGMPRNSYFWWRVPFYAGSGSVIYYHCKFHGVPGSGLGYSYGYGFGMVGRLVVL
jgi:plastocyanin